jgi:hypothetical protein
LWGEYEIFQSRKFNKLRMKEAKDEINTKRVCRGEYCNIHESIEVVEKRVGSVKVDHLDQSQVYETFPPSSTNDGMKVKEISSNRMIHQMKVISPVEMNDFMIVFSILTMTVILISIRVTFMIVFSKSRSFTRKDGITKIDHIIKYERNQLIEKAELLLQTAQALESRLHSEKPSNIDFCYQVLKRSIDSYFIEALHEEDVPTNFEQLLLSDIVSKTIFVLEAISDKLIEYHGSFRDNASRRREEICVRALSQLTNVGYSCRTVDALEPTLMLSSYLACIQVDERLEDLHMAIILCEGIGRIPPIKADIYKSSLNQLYLNEIRVRARALQGCGDSSLEVSFCPTYITHIYQPHHNND